MRSLRRGRLAALLVLPAMLVVACAGGTDPSGPDDTPAVDPPDQGSPDGEADLEGVTLTVYSGRSEELVGEVLAAFQDQTGIELAIRYGDTAELAATIVEEGAASPADVYFGQDAGALGALEAEGLFAELPDALLEPIDANYRSPSGAWTGVTGRVRVLAYSTERVQESELPASVFDLTAPEWQGRVGWAPTNGSFQAFVTAMRLLHGEDAARDWLEGMLANDPVVFENNASQLEGIERGEIDVALVNHYYLYRFLAESPDFPADNHYLSGDVGGLVNVAGVGVLASSEQQEAAQRLVEYLLSEDVQSYFAEVSGAPEFPLRSGVEAPDLPSIESLEPPEVDLSALEDLQGTLVLLQEVGALQ